MQHIRGRRWAALACVVGVLAAASAHAQYQEMHNFHWPTDGANPNQPAMLAQGMDGNLYGTLPTRVRRASRSRRRSGCRAARIARARRRRDRVRRCRAGRRTAPRPSAIRRGRCACRRTAPRSRARRRASRSRSRLLPSTTPSAARPRLRVARGARHRRVVRATCAQHATRGRHPGRLLASSQVRTLARGRPLGVRS